MRQEVHGCFAQMDRSLALPKIRARVLLQQFQTAWREAEFQKLDQALAAPEMQVRVMPGSSLVADVGRLSAPDAPPGFIPRCSPLQLCRHPATRSTTKLVLTLRCPAQTPSPGPCTTAAQGSHLLPPSGRGSGQMGTTCLRRAPPATLSDPLGVQKAGPFRKWRKEDA